MRDREDVETMICVKRWDIRRVNVCILKEVVMSFVADEFTSPYSRL